MNSQAAGETIPLRDGGAEFYNEVLAASRLADIISGGGPKGSVSGATRTSVVNLSGKGVPLAKVNLDKISDPTAHWLGHPRPIGPVAIGFQGRASVGRPDRLEPEVARLGVCRLP